MAKLFEIKAPEGVSNLKLDGQRRATVQIMVKNLSPAEIDGRATLVAVPISPVDTNHPVQKGWVKLDGPADKHFAVNQDATYTVKVAIPPQGPPGTYSFRLDVSWVAKPDEGDSSQAIKFEIPAGAIPGKPKWGLIAACALLFFAFLGGLVFFLTHHSASDSSAVPDLTGMTVQQATAALAPAKLTLNPVMNTIAGKPEDADHIVSQTPLAGQPIPTDLSIHITVGAKLVTVPLLKGLTVAQAQQALAPNLSIGQTTSAANPNFAGGVIFDQDPAEGQPVQSNSTVKITITPATVAVPVLIGMTIPAADNALRQAGLVVGSISGDQLQSGVINTDPGQNTVVTVGHPVNLRVPSLVTNCVAMKTCFYVGNAARYLARPSFQSPMKLVLH